eukprot:3170620-Prymnesium_polylepis.1
MTANAGLPRGGAFASAADSLCSLCSPELSSRMLWPERSSRHKHNMRPDSHAQCRMCTHHAPRHMHSPMAMADERGWLVGFRFWSCAPAQESWFGATLRRRHGGVLSHDFTLCARLRYLLTLIEDQLAQACRARSPAGCAAALATPPPRERAAATVSSATARV